MKVNKKIYSSLNNVRALSAGTCNGFVVLPADDEFYIDYETDIKPNLIGKGKIKEVKIDSVVKGYFVDNIFVQKEVLDLDGVDWAYLQQDITGKDVYCCGLANQPMPHPLHYSLTKKDAFLLMVGVDSPTLLHLMANHYKYLLTVDVQGGIDMQTSSFTRMPDDMAFKSLLKPSFDDIIERFMGSSYDRIADYAYLIYFIMARLKDQIFSDEEKTALGPVLDSFSSKVDKLERIVDRDLAIANMIDKRMQEILGE